MTKRRNRGSPRPPGAHHPAPPAPGEVRLGRRGKERRGPDTPILPEKCTASFLKAPKIARAAAAARVSLLFLRRRQPMRGEDAPPPPGRGRRPCLWARAAMIAAGCRSPVGRSAAAAQARRKRSGGSGGGGGSFPFPQPRLGGRMLTGARSPGPYLSGLLERRRKERENFGGVRSGGFRSNPQAV